nr:endonuclease Q family protein [Gorillibacterium massiliense]
MQEIKDHFVDLHIHIGRTEKGAPVKISASRDLTFYNIAREASERKGIDTIGIIDCHSPAVQNEIDFYLSNGEMEEVPDGGIRYRQTTVLLGSEIEVRDAGMGPAHLLIYLPTLDKMREFTEWMSRHMKNVSLSSQRIYVPARILQEEAEGRGGMVIPAHIFTPHKSLYGSCSSRMSDLLHVPSIAAVELGLSSDTEMASGLSELDGIPFVTNSDAHSLGKIGREYNLMRMAEASYKELELALQGRKGRGIAANFGLNPRLGKYHRTYCANCESIVDESQSSAERCLYCGSTKIVRGVMDRIADISDRPAPDAKSLATRPPYRYQVPLEFIPGLGKRKLKGLLDRFGTEMNILHRVKGDELAAAVGEDIAGMIIQAREGTLRLEAGGGGSYGKVERR